MTEYEKLSLKLQLAIAQCCEFQLKNSILMNSEVLLPSLVEEYQVLIQSMPSTFSQVLNAIGEVKEKPKTIPEIPDPGIDEADDIRNKPTLKRRRF